MSAAEIKAGELPQGDFVQCSVLCYKHSAIWGPLVTLPLVSEGDWQMTLTRDMGLAGVAD